MSFPQYLIKQSLVCEFKIIFPKILKLSILIEFLTQRIVNNNMPQMTKCFQRCSPCSGCSEYSQAELSDQPFPEPGAQAMEASQGTTCSVQQVASSQTKVCLMYKAFIDPKRSADVLNLKSFLKSFVHVLLYSLLFLSSRFRYTKCSENG